MKLRGWEVRKRRPLELEAHAHMVRGMWDVHRKEYSDDGPIDIVKVLEFLFQDRLNYRFAIVEDHEMSGFEGATWPSEKSMLLPQSVYDGACRGDPSARYTICHEIGHLVLHAEPPKYNKRMNVAGLDVWSDSEHQADYFASALLMPRMAILKARSIQMVMDSCGVSYAAAKERIEQIKNSAR